MSVAREMALNGHVPLLFFTSISQRMALCGALTVSDTVLGAVHATGEDRVSPPGACTPGRMVDNKYIRKLIKVISHAGKCEEEVKQGSTVPH